MKAARIAFSMLLDALSEECLIRLTNAIFCLALQHGTFLWGDNVFGQTQCLLALTF